MERIDASYGTDKPGSVVDVEGLRFGYDWFEAFECRISGLRPLDCDALLNLGDIMLMPHEGSEPQGDGDQRGLPETD